MSDNWIIFVPADPEWQPTLEAAEMAEAMCRSMFPAAEECAAVFHDHVAFHHPGENWSGVFCPRCHADLEAWWQSVMDEYSTAAAKNLYVMTLCCGLSTSLNELSYVWPATFGRFSLEVMNPNVADTTNEHDDRLATALGTRLRKVLVHI